MRVNVFFLLLQCHLVKVKPQSNVNVYKHTNNMIKVGFDGLCAKIVSKRWRKPEQAIIHALPDTYNKRHVDIESVIDFRLVNTQIAIFAQTL